MIDHTNAVIVANHCSSRNPNHHTPEKNLINLTDLINVELYINTVCPSLAIDLVPATKLAIVDLLSV